MSRSTTQRRDNVPAARELRVRQTSAEMMLWDALRGRRLAGLKVRRQHPIGTFVVDFCCPDRRLVIELGGAVHEQQKEHDAEREALLVESGYRVLRFSNDTIHIDLGAVLDTIRATALEQPPIPALRISLTGSL
jgi:very-short-patch-repair endonuclease